MDGWMEERKPETAVRACFFFFYSFHAYIHTHTQQTYVDVDESKEGEGPQLLALLEALEEDPDVQNVSHNARLV
jgi:transcriptional/translational regulatory protein YebC/TACO1